MLYPYDQTQLTHDVMASLVKVLPDYCSVHEDGCSVEIREFDNGLLLEHVLECASSVTKSYMQVFDNVNSNIAICKGKLIAFAVITES